MAKQPRVATDPELLKPIIEAVIFASEEPLSPRALIRLLAGEKENESPEEEVPPLVAAMNGHVPPVTTATEEVADAGVEAPEVEIDPVTTAVDEIGGEPSGSVSSAEVSSGDETVSAEAAIDPPTVSDPESAPETAVEMDGGDELAEAMRRVEVRVDAASLRPENGTIDQAYLRALIDELNDEYVQTGRAFRIVEVAGGFQFATVRDYGEFVAMLSKDKARRRLSPAALETLAIIAYRQPVSKPEVEAIRGVNCDQVLLNLMEKNLVAITGRSDAVGRPLLYATTDDFLRSFGLKGIGDLPKLREIEELMEEDVYSAERAEVITVDEASDVEEIEALVGAAGQNADRQEDGDGSPLEENISDAPPQSEVADAEAEVAEPPMQAASPESDMEPEGEPSGPAIPHNEDRDAPGRAGDTAGVESATDVEDAVNVDDVELAGNERADEGAHGGGRSGAGDGTEERGDEGIDEDGTGGEDQPDEARVREDIDAA